MSFEKKYFLENILPGGNFIDNNLISIIKKYQIPKNEQEEFECDDCSKLILYKIGKDKKDKIKISKKPLSEILYDYSYEEYLDIMRVKVFPNEEKYTPLIPILMEKIAENSKAKKIVYTMNFNMENQSLLYALEKLDYSYVKNEGMSYYPNYNSFNIEKRISKIITLN